MKEILKKARSRFHNDILENMEANKREIVKAVYDIKQETNSIYNQSKASVSIAEQNYFQNFKKIYSSLNDQMSKDIFWAVLQYRVDNDASKLLSLILSWDCQGNPNDFITILKRNKEHQTDMFVLYGTDDVSYQYYKNIVDLGYKFSYIVNDSSSLSPPLQNASRFGVEQISLESLVEDFPDSIILIGSWGGWEKKAYIVSKGFGAEHVFLNATLLKTEYFEDDILKPEEYEVFIDGGCYSLQTAIDFIDWYKRDSFKIIAFEPDKKNYQRCMERFSKEPRLNESNCIIYEAGLWDSKTKLSFTESGGGSYIADAGTTTISTETIDSVLSDGKVTFIKLDVEGAEMKALIGARKTICKYRPKMAICLYHRPEDIIDIPSYVLSLVPDYRLYIRHYSTNVTETVLLCV